MHSQHQGIRSLVDNLKFVLLLLAVFGDVGDCAACQGQLHLGCVIFGGFVTLKRKKVAQV